MRPWRWLVNILLLGVLLAQVGLGWQLAVARPAAQPLAPGEWLSPAAHLGGSATSIQFLEDDYAALALGVDLLVLDVLGPYAPVQVGKLSFRELIKDLHVHSQSAYVLSAGRVHVVDLSDPRQPRSLGTLLVDDVRALDSDANYLYIGAESTEIYTLADPANPQLVGSYTAVDYYSDIFGPPVLYHPPVELITAAFPYLYLQLRYLVCIYDCFPYFAPVALDISAPGSPVEVGSLSTTVRKVAALGDYYFVLGDLSSSPGDQNLVWVAAQAAAPELEPLLVLPYHGSDLALQADRLYLSGGEVGLRILDVSDPLAPVELGQESTLQDARQLALQGNLAFVAGGSQGLGVFNVRHPAAPVFAGSYRTAGSVEQVLLQGETLYASSDQLDILDVSDPRQPRTVGMYPYPGRVALSGEVLFLAAGAQGLISLDVADPAAPRALGRLELAGEAKDVTVWGDYAYVASSAGLQVVAVADPAALVLVATVAGFSAREILAGPDFTALITATELRLFDLADPQSPQQAYLYEMPDVDEYGSPCANFPGTAQGLASDGERFYVIWDLVWFESKVCSVETGGLLVFAPSQAGSWELAGEAYLGYGLLDVEVSGGTGYILADQAGVLQLSVFDPLTVPGTQPRLVHRLPAGQVGTHTAALAVQEDLLAVGNYEAGIFLLQYWSPQVLFMPVLHRSSR